VPLPTDRSTSQPCSPSWQDKSAQRSGYIHDPAGQVRTTARSAAHCSGRPPSPGPTVTTQATPRLYPLVFIAQLYVGDVPGLPVPPGADVCQVLWCPSWDHERTTRRASRCAGGIPRVTRGSVVSFDCTTA
jgi:hypothetical protein